MIRLRWLALSMSFLFGALLTCSEAQTSVLYWCDSNNTNKINLTVQKVGNRYYVSNVAPTPPTNRNTYIFLDWDMRGTASQPGTLNNVEVEAGQLHLIHIHSVAKPWTVNDFYDSAAQRESYIAFLWVGGVPLAQTNMSSQLTEIRESGSWFYFEQTNRLSFFAQRFPNFTLPAGKSFQMTQRSVRDTDAAFAAHAISDKPRAPGPNTFHDMGQTEFQANYSWSDMTDTANWLATTYDYLYLDFEFWNKEYETGTLAKLVFLVNECKRINPNVKVGDWWAGPPYNLSFAGAPGRGWFYEPDYVLQDYNPAVALTRTTPTLMQVVNGNGVMTNLGGAANCIPVGLYVGAVWADISDTNRVHYEQNGYIDSHVPRAIHTSRVNKSLGINAGKPTMWFSSDEVYQEFGEPLVEYSVRTTSPPGVYKYSGNMPYSPNYCEAISFFSMLEGDGIYVWNITTGLDNDPNHVFENSGYGTWIPDVPGTPQPAPTNRYPMFVDFNPDYTALGVWKYSTIADIIKNGQKMDFQYSTNNGVSWYNPPANGSSVCDGAQPAKFRPIVVGGVTSNQIAIAAYHPYQSATSTTHVTVRYLGNNYDFDVFGKRVRVFKGNLSGPGPNSPPVLTHTPVGVIDTTPLTISATATDDVQVAGATLWWRQNEGTWTSTNMSVQAGAVSGVISPSILSSYDQFDYWLSIVDDRGAVVSNSINRFIYAPAPFPVYKAAGSTWRYLATASAPPGTWKDPGFNDGSWTTGAAPLGYGGDADLQSEVSYGGQLTNKYPTTYFRTTFMASNAAALLDVKLCARVDDGLVIYLNGAEIQRANMPTGTITYSTLATGNASNPPRPWQVVAVDPAAIQNGTNTLAVEVHQAGASSSDLYFDLHLQPLSQFSGAVSVTPILGNSVQTGTPPWTISAQTPNPEQVASMSLVWNQNGGIWHTQSMPHVGGGLFSASLEPGAYAGGDQFGYEIRTISHLGLGTTNGPFGLMHFVPPGPILLNPESTWKYLAGSSAPAASWNTTGFNDASWPSGPAPLGFGDQGDVKTQLGYGAVTTNKYRTYYFRNSFVASEPGVIASMNAYCRLDDGMVLYINGVEAGRYNMATGSVDYNTLASASGISPPRPWSSLSINPALLVTGQNCIAVEVHQVSSGSSDLFFDLFLNITNSHERTVHIAPGATGWMYHNTGALPATNWTSAAYSDSTWSSGTAPLGYGGVTAPDNPLATTLSYGSDDQNKWAAYYFRKRFTVTSPGVVTGLIVRCKADDGVAFSLNGVPIHGTPNLPAQPANNMYTTSDASEPYDWYQFTISPSMLVVGDNVLAAEVHQGGPASSDVYFDMTLVSVDYATTNQSGSATTNGTLPATNSVTWTAYNDMAWFIGQASNKITTYTTSGGNLVNYATGQGLAARVDLTTSDTLAFYDIQDATPTAGSDAYTLFEGKVSCRGWMHDITLLSLTFSNLDPTRLYTIVLFGNRVVYPDRYSELTISDVDSFVNASSAGATLSTKSLTDDTTTLQSGSNSAGRVCRFANIQPGLDGDMVITVTRPPGSANAYLNAFMIQEQGTATGDSDSDGMPDAWEQSYFGTASGGSSAADLDGDGTSNLDEYIAGTHPVNAGSFPAFNASSILSGQIRFELPTATGRRYDIDYSTSLFGGNWLPLQTNILGGGTNITITDGSGQKHRYYRYRVRLP